jgi:hypothetical protein
VADFGGENHGTIYLLRALTERAVTWVNEHLPEGAQWFGDAVAVEPRFIHDIVVGAVTDGLRVR